MKIVSLAGTSSIGSEKYSLGFSIASIGEPAVTFPNKGTFTTSSFLGINSFSQRTSIVLNFPFPFVITPFNCN